jgi:arylformamidase
MPSVRRGKFFWEEDASRGSVWYRNNGCAYLRTTEAMLYDITPPIGERLCVWPGDTPPSRAVLLDMRRGDSITLSSLHATVHLGAHADAPSHYGVDAPTIDERSLDYYLGPCQVQRVIVPRARRITPDMLPHPVTAPRLLLATGTYPDPQQFNEDFAALSPQLVQDLHRQGVRLVGIDTPSVDLFDSKDLPAHRMFLECDMAILEGIVLTEVPEGIYELLALPLRLTGFDASPVRAVLRDRN